MYAFCEIEPPTKITVTPQEFYALHRLADLKNARLMSDNEFAERAKAIKPELKSYHAYELVVDWNNA